jgi:predicted metal-dependent enzyme (double-stranded beta helix superfamily)
MSDADPEFIHDHTRVREPVELVNETAVAREAVPALLGVISPAFETLLADDDWLLEQYRRLPDEYYDNKGEMGDDIAQWLLYREGPMLALFTLVLLEGASTLVHDRLAWGMVGLYKRNRLSASGLVPEVLHDGCQRETFYRRVDDSKSDRADLEQNRSEKISRGDYYRLVPPENDIHSVEAVSREPSVSVQPLGADAGCVERHAYSPGKSAVNPFDPGYTNVECEVDVSGHDHENMGVHAGGDHALGEGSA